MTIILNYYIVWFEYAPKGDLLQLLQKEGKLKEHDAAI
jgi:hypothetical protein